MKSKRLADDCLKDSYKNVLVISNWVAVPQIKDLEDAASKVAGVKTVPLLEAVFVNYCQNYILENVSKVIAWEISVECLSESILAGRQINTTYGSANFSYLSIDSNEVQLFDVEITKIFLISNCKFKDARMALQKGAQSYKFSTEQKVSRAIISEKNSIYI